MAGKQARDETSRYSFTDEQEEFRTVLRRFLDDKSPTTEVRRLMESETGWERAGWRELNNQLGLTAIAIPEAYGGQGFGFVELCIVLEEMGRALLCAPYFSSAVLATQAILNAGSEEDKEALLPAIASGETIATLAFTEDSGGWDSGSIEMTATPSGSGCRLDGVKSFVLDGAAADLIVVVARRPASSGDDGLGFFVVDASADELEKTPLVTMDTTRKLARLQFNGVEAKPLGEGNRAGAAFAKTMQQAAIALASEMVGGAERLRESAVEYAMMRMQFGRPIGSFQAIKHKCADMLVDVELAKAAAYYAAAAAADDDGDLPAIASLAKACVSDAYMKTAIDTIQIHGGIGFTWDNDTHLWFKRAKSSEVFLGDAHYHRELMLRHWDV